MLDYILVANIYVGAFVSVLTNYFLALELGNHPTNIDVCTCAFVW